MGDNEQGASIALPIFVDFMKKTLKGKKDRKFYIPKGVKFVKIDYKTGGDPSLFSRAKTIEEAFKDSDAKQAFERKSIGMQEQNEETENLDWVY